MAVNRAQKIEEIIGAEQLKNHSPDYRMGIKAIGSHHIEVSPAYAFQNERGVTDLYWIPFSLKPGVPLTEALKDVREWMQSVNSRARNGAFKDGS